MKKLILPLRVFCFLFFVSLITACTPQTSSTPTSNTPAPAPSPAAVSPEPTPPITPPPAPVSPNPDPTPAPDPAPAPTPPPAAQPVTLQVTAKQWEFIPSTIVVKKGQKVTLQITSQDVTHGFSLPDFGVNAVLTPGQTTVVEFTPDKTGSFSFFCSVFCGAGHTTMRGTLVVQ